MSHPDVDAVILTGGTDTALRMLAKKPEMHLFAETGGKNASIITALSDRELAIKHVVQSAFGHGGQKCSATSLLLLEAEVYDDPAFKRMLCDAVKSLEVGSAWDLPTRVGPLLRPPSGALEEALKTLEPGESWGVMPHPIGDNPHLWSPAVKYGVTPGSVTHLTEFFGPVLAVMRFENLTQAIDLVNATGYGLTSAIHSLDDREIAQWKAGIRAGNLYINRGTTGAIVLRQPFGGMGKSCFGPGLKAGGPNYVASFLRFADRQTPSQTPAASAPIRNPDLARLAEEVRGGSSGPSSESSWLLSAIASYDTAWADEFSKEHDHFRLIGQDNFRRYLPFREVCLRITAQDRFEEVVARAAAARVTGARVLACFAPDAPKEWRIRLDEWTDSWAAGIEIFDQTDAAFAQHVREQIWPRIRFAGRQQVSPDLRKIAAESGTWLADVPVVGEGRVELLWYLREQSLSYDYHRYGNLGSRASESRRPLVPPNEWVARPSV